ncbi:YfmQ family protein, partial [Bacillus pumilus]
FEDRPLDDQQASEIIQHFNDAIFIERYYIYPGDEAVSYTHLEPTRPST